jgi:hypothetical protein
MQAATAWDRVGSATGVASVLVVSSGLVVGRAATGSSAAAPPGLDATSDQIVVFASHQMSGAGLMTGIVSTAFVLLAVFLAKLLLGLQRAEAGTGWLSGAALAGAVVYLVLDLIRFMVGTSLRLSVGHHLTTGEATALFDISNALTPYTWGAIAMLMIPTGLAAIRTQSLPLWLGWSAFVIGLANLIWAWLPPGGMATPAELAFLLWIVVTSLWLVWRPMLTSAYAGGLGEASARTD